MIAPSSLCACHAADALAPIWNEVVVIGAAALQILFADDVSARPVDAPAIGVLITPTRDVDVAVEAGSVEVVVAQLERAGLTESDEPYERGFTWVLGDLKIQLVRPFHGVPPQAAVRLPVNPHLSLLAQEQHRLTVAFAEAPETPRLLSANAAALVALKGAAFGRDRPGGAPVERDYHDVFTVVSARGNDLEEAYRAADYRVRSLTDGALGVLATGGNETTAAAREHAAITGEPDVAAHERDIVRAMVFMQRRLAP